jgi:RNA polymerase sigma factor (sigma-70 family)
MTSRRAQFEAQVLIHLDAGLRLARVLMRSANAAEDRLQDAVVRAFRGFEGLRGEQAGPWFLTIVRNTCLTALVRDRRHEHMPLPEDEAGNEWLTDPAAGPEELASAAQQSEDLTSVLETIPAAYREVLLLREVEGLDYRQIAEVTGVRMGTVMSRLARARAALRSRWLQNQGSVSHEL